MRIADLLDEHRAFEEALAGVRAAVHTRRIDSAREGFAWLDRALRRHIDFEERALLPRFDRLDHPIPNGAPAVFRRDHAQILDRLDRIAQHWDEPIPRAEDLGRLQGLLEHHDRREARYLKPRLDRELDPAEVARILSGHPHQDAPPTLPEREPEPLPPAPDGPPLEQLRACVAVGDSGGALRALEALGPTLEGKASSLAAQVADGIRAVDWPRAQDRLWLLLAAARARPTDRTPRG